uniref:Uncharacterized protein n=1 Tax=Anguilla anguilla TaxID=7936 RepID=A0A0E9W3Z7_ANGAN
MPYTYVPMLLSFLNGTILTPSERRYSNLHTVHHGDFIQATHSLAPGAF